MFFKNINIYILSVGILDKNVKGFSRFVEPHKPIRSLTSVLFFKQNTSKI